jgi:hypothetical protein
VLRYWQLRREKKFASSATHGSDPNVCVGWNERNATATIIIQIHADTASNTRSARACQTPNFHTFARWTSADEKLFLKEKTTHFLTLEWVVCTNRVISYGSCGWRCSKRRWWNRRVISDHKIYENLHTTGTGRPLTNLFTSVVAINISRHAGLTLP